MPYTFVSQAPQAILDVGNKFHCRGTGRLFQPFQARICVAFARPNAKTQHWFHVDTRLVCEAPLWSNSKTWLLNAIIIWWFIISDLQPSKPHIIQRWKDVINQTCRSHVLELQHFMICQSRHVAYLIKIATTNFQAMCYRCACQVQSRGLWLRELSIWCQIGSTCSTKNHTLRPGLACPLCRASISGVLRVLTSEISEANFTSTCREKTKLDKQPRSLIAVSSVLLSPRPCKVLVPASVFQTNHWPICQYKLYVMNCDDILLVLQNPNTGRTSWAMFSSGLYTMLAHLVLPPCLHSCHVAELIGAQDSAQLCSPAQAFGMFWWPRINNDSP